MHFAAMAPAGEAEVATMSATSHYSMKVEQKLCNAAPLPAAESGTAYWSSFARIRFAAHDQRAVSAGRSSAPHDGRQPGSAGGLVLIHLGGHCVWHEQLLARLGHHVALGVPYVGLDSALCPETLKRCSGLSRSPPHVLVLQVTPAAAVAAGNWVRWRRIFLLFKANGEDEMSVAAPAYGVHAPTVAMSLRLWLCMRALQSGFITALLPCKTSSKVSMPVAKFPGPAVQGRSLEHG